MSLDFPIEIDDAADGKFCWSEVLLVIGPRSFFVEPADPSRVKKRAGYEQQSTEAG